MALTKWQSRAIARTTEKVYRDTTESGVYSMNATVRMRLSKYGNDVNAARDALTKALDDAGFGDMVTSPGIVLHYHLHRVLQISVRGSISGTRKMDQFMRLIMLASVNECE